MAFNAFAVGQNGVLNVASLDLSTQKGWQGLETVGAGTLVPGSPVAVLRVSDTLLMALTIDCSGVLNIFSLDLTNQKGWEGPEMVGPGTLVPGSPVAVLRERDTIFAAFTVDRNGLLNIFSLDTTNQKGWQGPDTLGGGMFVPGSPVAVLKKRDTLFSAFVVDRNGVLNIFALDLNNQKGWQGPDTFGSMTLVPGAPVGVAGL